MSPKPPVKFLTFEEWLAENSDMADEEFEGFAGVIECTECDGTGTIEVNEQDDYAFRHHMESLYNERKRDDAKKLLDWNRMVNEANSSQGAI